MNNELYHYGVKGMRWGVRKKKDKQYIPTDPEKHRRLSDYLTWKAKQETLRGRNPTKGMFTDPDFSKKWKGWVRKERDRYYKRNNYKYTLSSSPNASVAQKKSLKSLFGGREDPFLEKVKKQAVSYISALSKKVSTAVSVLKKEAGGVVNSGASFVKKLLKK